MTKSEVQNAFKNYFLPLLKDKGYSFYSKKEDGPYPNFLKKFESGTVDFGLYMTPSYTNFYAPEIRFDEVENHILNDKIIIPNLITKGLKASTLRHISMRFKEQIYMISEELSKSYFEKVENYLNEEGFAFIEKYCVMSNVYAEINRLQALGGEAPWAKFINGSLDGWYRVLIISKLFNDDSIDEKLKIIRKFFTDNVYPPSHLLSKDPPAFEATLPYIMSIEPKYSL